MQFEWDQNKSQLNLIKHGISFEEAQQVFNGPTFTAEDKRKDYGERRFVSIGTINRRVVLVVAHTDRQGRIRIISVRKANTKEKRLYYEYLKTKS